MLAQCSLCTRPQSVAATPPPRLSGEWQPSAYTQACAGARSSAPSRPAARTKQDAPFAVHARRETRIPALIHLQAVERLQWLVPLFRCDHIYRDAVTAITCLIVTRSTQSREAAPCQPRGFIQCGNKPVHVPESWRCSRDDVVADCVDR